MTMKAPKIHAVVFTAALSQLMFMMMMMMPQYSMGQIIIDADSGSISDNDNDNENNSDKTPTTASAYDNQRPMISSPFSKPSSLFSDFFNLQDDFFDNVFRKDFHSFFFPSMLDSDENDNLIERNFFFQSPFDDLATSLQLGGRRDDHHDQGLVPAPHSLLRGGIDRNAFFSSIHPTNIELVDDDTTYQVSMRLPEEIQVKDVDVHLDNSGTRLVIEGHTSTTKDSNNSGNDLDPTNVAITTTSQHFVQSFLVDPKVVEVDRFVASVKDGRLTISAPKDRRKIKNVHHSIPVQNLDDIRSIPSPSGLISDATRYAQGLSAKDLPVETKNHLSEEFKSVRDELTRKRNDQMSKFTKLGLDSAIDEGRDVDSDRLGEPQSSQIEDDDPSNIILKNSNNWKEVSESTL